MEKGKIKEFGIQRTTTFSGKRRVGIDTNILIRIYEQPSLFEYEEARIFNRKDVMFVHRLCFKELVRHLIKKGMYENQAKEEAGQFLQDHNIREIYHFIPEREIKKFEKDSNEKLNKMGKDYLRCHVPDSIILLAFKRENINKIISTDEAFKICATFLGMDSESIPSLGYTISRKLRKIFDYKRRYHKRKH